VRFERLDLVRWGALEGVTFDLSRGAHGLHVIYGDNEAGKSTTRRAISALLFGVPGQSADRFRFDYKLLRLGAVVRFAGGRTLAFQRRKGNKGTILGDDEAPIDAAALERALGGVDREAFEREWSLDHEQLRAGGAALLRGDGELGQSLLAAGLGGIGVAAMASELDAEAKELFGKRSSRVVKLLEQIKDRRRARDAHAVLMSDVERLRADRDRLDAERRQAEAASRAIGRELASWGRVDAEREAREAAAVALERARRDVLDSRERLASIVVDDRVLRCAAAIAALEAGLSAHRERLEHLATWEAERARTRSELEALATSVGVSVDTLAELAAKPYRALHDRARALLDAHADARAQRSAAEETRRAEELSLADLEVAMRAREGAAPDDRVVEEVATRVARAAGEASLAAVVDRLAELDVVARDAALAARHAFEALPRWSHEPLGRRALENARLPTQEEVDVCRRRLEVRAEVAAARKAEAAAAAEVATRDAAVARLSSTTMPTEARVREARARRDRGWTLVRETLEGQPPDEASVREFAGRGLLGDAFERAVHDADDLADKLRSGAADAARLEAAVDARTKAAEELALQTRRRLDAEAAVDAAIGELRALFRPLGVQADSPEEMQAWLAAAERVRELFRAETRAVSDLSTIEARLRDEIAPLITLLGATGTEGVVETLRVADARIRRGAEVRREQEEAARELARARERVLALHERERLCALRESERSAEWEAFVSQEGLPRSKPAREIVAILGAVVLAAVHLSRGRGLDRAIAAATRQRDAYLADVHAAAEASGEDATGSDVTDLVRALALRLHTARALDHARRTEHARWKDAERRVAEDARRFALGDPGSRSPAEALAGLAEDARPTPAPGLRGREELERAQAREDALVVQRSQEIGAIEAELGRAMGGSDAAEDESAVQGLIASLGEVSADFLRLSFARDLLRRAAESYRQQNQSPILARTSELLVRLTLGSFSGVVVDDEDDRGRSVIKALRGDHELVPVDAMSDGARDQLFLALRVAALERQLERGEPLPFVVDDILIQLSDARAAAALDVLAELADKTQVLLFTHHARVVELARGLAAREVFVHHIGAPPPLDVDPHLQP
jgi:uncharacterized protein YhaN